MDDDEASWIVSTGTEWYPVDGPIVVWLTEYRTYGFLLHEGAHVSTISFINPENGERLIEQVENDEYEYWGEHAIDYDAED